MFGFNELPKFLLNENEKVDLPQCCPLTFKEKLIPRRFCNEASTLQGLTRRAEVVAKT